MTHWLLLSEDLWFLFSSLSHLAPCEVTLGVFYRIMWVNFYINLNSDKTRIHHVSSALHMIRVCNMRLHISSLLPGEPTRPTTHQEAQDVKLTHPHTRGKLFFPTYGSTCLIFHLNMQPLCSVPGGVKRSLHLVNDAGSQFLQGKPPENTNHARSARVEKRAASAA